MAAVHLQPLWERALGCVEGIAGRWTGSAATDIHVAMVLASAGHFEKLDEHIAAMQNYDEGTVTARFVDALPTATAVCTAIKAHAQRRFAEAASLLHGLEPEGVVPDAWRCLSLSNAQRDVVSQLLISSSWHSENSEDRAAAAAMVDARRAASLGAAWGERLRSRAAL